MTTGSRRHFIRTAATTVAAAAVPGSLMAQADDAYGNMLVIDAFTSARNGVPITRIS